MYNGADTLNRASYGRHVTNLESYSEEKTLAVFLTLQRRWLHLTGMKMVPSASCWALCLFMIGTMVISVNTVGKPLHQHMTEIELQRYFGVQTSEDVPEYVISEPYQSNGDGDFVSHTLHERHTRDVHDKGAWHYKMDAFGKKMHLKLRRNTQLVKPGLELETRHANGDVTWTPVKSDSYFHGKETSDPGSFVAVSNDKGLTGMIKLSRDTLFVHPLPDHLAKHVTTGSGAKPHLVYKKSKEIVHCQTKTAPAFLKVAKKDKISGNSNDVVVHKYLQAALVADDDVTAKLGNNSADILLGIANIVAGTFHDNSIGQIKLNYVVSRLVLITNKELQVSRNSTSGHRLDKIYDWAYKHNPVNKSDPMYFDVVSLVFDSCCGGGLALLGAVCSRTINGNVNGFIGLQTAGIISHETAHNMGIDHDGGKNCPDGINIMATGMANGEGSLKWSACSEYAIQQYLSGPGSKCLEEPPRISLPALANQNLAGKLPGVVYNGNSQCQFLFGGGYYRIYESNCVTLYCTKDWNGGWSMVVGPVDGTSCGPRHWCIHSKCVDNGSPRINGGWSEWSDYTPCSQTCGGGVQYRERTCTNPTPKNDGDKCLGSARGKWNLCNFQTECPLPSYRDLQCKKIKPDTVGYYYRDTCYLACLRQNVITYPHGKVADGTRCTDDLHNFDVCIAGKCRAVGCDHVLESGKRKDRCGICDGIGDTCILEKSAYTKDYRRYGFDNADTIVVLPVGTLNARIKKRGVTLNFLGIKDHLTGQYIISLPTYSRTVKYNGTRVAFTRAAYEYADSIEVDGPTNVPLRVVFAYIRGVPQGVDYQYFRPLLSNESAPTAVSSKWIAKAWSGCSGKCGQGVSTRGMSCVRSDDETPASLNSCSNLVKPESQKPCNLPNSCTTEWHLTKWNECSKTCGNGDHFRLLYCRKKFNDSYFEKLVDSACNISTKPNVTMFQRCNEVMCPAEWKPLPWSECSVTCGGGLMTRKLECIRTNELGHVTPAADTLCQRYAVKPLTENACNKDKHCDPPPEIQVACFIGADNLKEVLGDFTNKIDWDNTNEVVKKCAKLARAKGYALFALGKNGLCLSGVDMKHKYHISGTDGAHCKDGIGMSNSMFVYSLDRMPSLQPIGCYYDSYFDRALPVNYANFRDQIIWTKMGLTVKQCAHVARDRGYKYFSVQYYGECYGGKGAGKSFDKHGKSTDCWQFDKQLGFAVGKDWTNFVYHILN